MNVRRLSLTHQLLLASGLLVITSYSIHYTKLYDDHCAAGDWGASMGRDSTYEPGQI